MELKYIAGGFTLSPYDEALLLQQRAITKAINDSFVQVGAVFLKTSSKNPYDEDWFRKTYRDVDLQAWIDDPELRGLNAGFNLQLGWMDVDIDAEDPEFNRCILAAMSHLSVDTRFSFGRASVGFPTHVLLQLGEDESQNFEYLTRFEPREFRISGKRYHVQLRSFPTNTKAENVAKSAKQTVMPGSIYTHKAKAGDYDISVWYTASGKVAENVKNVAATTPRRVNFNEVVRAITFGVFLYLIKDSWVEGSRHSTAQKVGGWLARVVADSQAINNHEAISDDVFCPVDTDQIAESLLHFVCKFMGDEEAHMRVRAYRDACEKLKRNPDAKIAGWPTMAELLGGEKVVALRTVFMPGSDVSQLTKMAERYVYDETDNRYLDRQRFFSFGNYVHEAGDLERRHKGDTIKIAGKNREAFRVYESSDMRTRIGYRDLYPELAPGGIYRISSIGEVLNDDEDDDGIGALSVFNTWRGWAVRPADTPDADLMNDLVTRLDQVLGYLTRDNADQIDWIKKWLAWTFQHPGDKQQIAWVVVGEQGIGKSWIGNVFVKSLMGNLWGTASPKVMDGDFSVEPFVEKMFVFIDEAKFQSETGTDEIKKLIRSTDVPGAIKFQSAKNHRLFSRLMFASNRLNMNIGQTNVTDRALFYTRAYDREFTHMTEQQFRSWAETLKPFFTEFTELMVRRDVREHFMRYFIDLPVDKYDVESIKHSASTDEAIVTANMGWARRIAKAMIEDARVFEDLDISFPFTMAELSRRVGELAKEMSMNNVQPARVLNEFEQADVLEKIVVPGGIRKMRFKYKYGTLLDAFGEAIGAKLERNYEIDAEKDTGPNDNDGTKMTPWRGAKKTSIVRSYV